MYGELIRAARKKKGWTQSDLAYKLGINPVGIVQWEQNRRNPKFETRQKIARALDIDITELMLLSEKEDYEKKHGDCESRINFAVYEIERLLDEKTEQIECFKRSRKRSSKSRLGPLAINSGREISCSQKSTPHTKSSKGTYPYSGRA